MKLATVHLAGQDEVVVATADQEAVVLLRDLYEDANLGTPPATLRALLDRGPGELDRIRAALPRLGSLSKLPGDTVTWRPPVPEPSKVLGVAMNNGALNNTAHVPPAGPMFFLKPQNALVGHLQPIEIADDYGFTFPELELAVVIGSPARHVTERDALDHVAGYTIANDVTSQGLKRGDSIAVDITPEMRRTPGYEDYFSWRRSHGDDDNEVYFTYHTRSKGADTFGPMGPYLTTKDEIPDPDDLTVRGYADGDLFAEDSTARYSYPVAEVVSWASRYFTLNPGDVILCGTAAKGTERYPRAHHNIDVSTTTPKIDIDIAGLGRLTNHVIHTSRPVAATDREAKEVSA
ncbi:fumarylacetoacetate hydrolase family protein [Streptomyces griseorubiginosus]|uniref:fumarylacetoacetate hydrolase family protein n=1 Tax=Streptomyces griseorubiginosus TaxID=67304 RepID=UPI0011408C19|nr:fumarylacetoacetate hydrolase family protein [Streptomyces griseorubiginosus]